MQQCPHGKRIVKRRALVIQHYVIRARHAHHVIHARRGQQSEQGIHIVLIRIRMVRVTDIATHR
jgi:hypothetical protein